MKKTMPYRILTVATVAALTTVVFLVNGCTRNQTTDGGRAMQQSISQNTFSDTVQNFNVNVFYETGAAPYVGTIGLTANQTWDITKTSYQALFQNHNGRTVAVPTTLAQMTQIPDQLRSSWTSNDLIQLGNQYAPALVNNRQIGVSVFFLNGTFEGDSNILGVHLTGVQYAFVFKDVVVNAGGDSVSQRYVEQATVVHEIGHTVGLVNNGVPMVTNHEDSAHSHHTTRTSCVMHWTVESRSNILTSIGGLILGNQLNLFGVESLQDGRGYHP